MQAFSKAAYEVAALKQSLEKACISLKLKLNFNETQAFSKGCF